MAGRPRLPFNTFGAIRATAIGGGHYRAQSRFRDADGQVRQVTTRIGEVLALRQCDVDMDAGPPRVIVCGTIVVNRGAGAVRQAHPKTHESNRVIGVPQFAADVIRQRLKLIDPEDTEHLLFTLLVIDEGLLDEPDESTRSMLLEGLAPAPRFRVHADAITDRIVHNTIWVETGGPTSQRQYQRPPKAILDGAQSLKYSLGPNIGSKKALSRLFRPSALVIGPELGLTYFHALSPIPAPYVRRAPGPPATCQR